MIENKDQKIFFVRHGQSESNVDRNILKTKANWAIELTDLGKKQADELGEKLNKEFTHATIYYSPFIRAKQTAEIARKNIEGDFIEDFRIRELEVGNLIENPRALNEDRVKHGNNFFYRFPSGESCADVYFRVKDFYQSEKIESIKCPIILFSHAATIRVFHFFLNKMTVDEFNRLKKPKNCSLYSFNIISREFKEEII